MDIECIGRNTFFDCGKDSKFGRYRNGFMLEKGSKHAEGTHSLIGDLLNVINPSTTVVEDDAHILIGATPRDSMRKNTNFESFTSDSLIEKYCDRFRPIDGDPPVFLLI